MTKRSFLAAGLMALTVACGPSEPLATTAAQEQGPVSASEAASTPAGHDIDWFDGTVEEAFAAALAADKPIFLYWGAEWCPPCHQIKDQIFARPAFIQKSRLFIPVYLDGDTERAQKHGDRFGVLGCPTIIVFSPGGRELTRIPGGLDIGLYADVLDLTLEEIRPVADIVDAVLADAPVSADDYRLLGFYSWTQDDDRALADADPVVAFRKMSANCPANLEDACARLFAEYLRVALAADKDEANPFVMADEEKQAALNRVFDILGKDSLSRTSFPLLVSYADAVVARG